MVHVLVDGTWYEPLLVPVRPTVESALRELGEIFAGDPWSVPRAGLGAALALHVASGFGSAGTKRARRLCASSLEAWNQRVHRRDVRVDRALARSSRDVLRAWSYVVRRDDTRALRVIARLVPAWSAEAPVPEGVVFLRASVAAGVLLGDVDDAVHARLDRWATFTALAWEARQGTLDRPRWEGSLAAIGVGEPFPPDADRTASDRAAAELEELDEGAAALALARLAQSIPRTAAAARDPEAWEPALAPDPRPIPRPSHPLRTPLDAFAAEHAPAIEGAIADLATGLPPRIGRALDYVSRQGGKRVRPLLVLASARTCGGDPGWALREAALVEWLHQASLVIDDVIDGATVRRGGPALHAATSVAFATSVALQLLARLAVAARDLRSEGRIAFAEAAATLAEGEWAEMQRTGDPQVSITDYHRIVEAKTARLFSTASMLGALAAGAQPAHVRALTRAGHAAGLAFQIVDDLLDVIGEARELGKEPGTDLRARKTTLPLILAREAADAGARSRLDAIVRGERPVDERELAFVRDLVRASGAEERCRERAAALLERARRDLARLPDREGAELVMEVHRRCVERER